ncbi:hypothetical protein ColLi_10968 [Colletotrichum liriopes]|uniref:BTB domain-containing protein n=1 Tax=Colletotrichum liriopes TaxID=708192 RepID=A0AA37GVN3_9PEZI|nr:hypothetical protein ColLi_10968 [Colletotrichum liriopes]
MMERKNALKATSPQKTPELHVFDNFHGSSLDVGPEVSNGQKFKIPHDLLRLSEELENICGSRHKVLLEDIPDEAGHVLLHYLHTGSWQTLRVNESTPTAIHSTQLKVSLYVYGAARIYKLPGLAELAKEKICHYAGRLPALEILGLASDAGRLLGEDDLWFSAFIRLRIQQLFEDPTSLNKKVLLECFRSATTYSGILIKGLIDICHEKSTMAAPSIGATEPESESVVVFTPESKTARSTDSAQSKPELAVEVLPEPEAASSNVTVELKPGLAVGCAPVPIDEPDLTKKKLTKKEKKKMDKEKKKMEKERLAFEMATLERAAKLPLEPELGDAAKPELNRAVDFLLETEVAPSPSLSRSLALTGQSR